MHGRVEPRTWNLHVALKAIFDSFDAGFPVKCTQDGRFVDRALALTGHVGYSLDEPDPDVAAAGQCAVGNARQVRIGRCR